MSRTALAILGLLTEKPMHGYEISQTIKERWMDRWATISVPSIYNTIKRLSEKNYIKEERKEKIGKIPQRYIYNLTDKGREYLKELVEEGLEGGVDGPKTRGTFWLALVFIQYASADIAKNALEKMVLALTNSIEKLNADKKMIESYGDNIPVQWYAILYSGLEYYKIELKYLQYVLDNFDKTGCEKNK